MSVTMLRLTGDRQLVWADDDALERPSREAFLDTPEGQAAFDAALAEWKGAFRIADGRFARAEDVKPFWVRSGCEPTIFCVGSLTVAQASSVAGLRLGEGSREAIAYGCHDIRGLRVEDENGKPVELKWKRCKGEHGMRLPDEILAIFNDSGLRLAMWLAIQESSGVSPEARFRHRPPLVDV